MQRSRLLVTDAAELPPRQATGSLIMTLGRIKTMTKPGLLILWSMQFLLMGCSVAAFHQQDRKIAIILLLSSYAPSLLGARLVGITPALQESANSSVPKWTTFLFNCSALAFIAIGTVGKRLSPNALFLASVCFLVTCILRDAFLASYYFSEKRK